MKAILIVAMAALGLGAASVAGASEDLAKSAGCATCHATDTKKMGPSYKSIAAKFKCKPRTALTRPCRRWSPT